jgi:hypothetical protein
MDLTGHPLAYRAQLIHVVNRGPPDTCSGQPEGNVYTVNSVTSEIPAAQVQPDACDLVTAAY